MAVVYTVGTELIQINNDHNHSADRSRIAPRTRTPTLVFKNMSSDSQDQ